MKQKTLWKKKWSIKFKRDFDKFKIKINSRIKFKKKKKAAFLFGSILPIKYGSKMASLKFYLKNSKKKI